MSDPDFSFLDSHEQGPPKKAVATKNARNEADKRFAVACLGVCMILLWAVLHVTMNPYEKAAKYAEKFHPKNAVKSDEELTRDLVQKLCNEYEFMKSAKAPLRDLASKCREIAECYKTLRDKDGYAKFKEIEKRFSGDYESSGSFGTMGY